MKRYYPSLMVPFLVVMLVALQTRPSSANLIAADSYAIGSNPSAGQYQSGIALPKQPGTLANTGFVGGGYGNGIGGTAQFTAQSSTTFGYAPFGSSSNAGMVNYAQAVDGMNRSVARNFTTGTGSANAMAAASPTLWFNILVSQAGTNTTTNGYVLASLGNTIIPASGIGGTTSGNYQGLAFGFAANGTANDAADLVIRYRNVNPTGSPTATTADATLVSGATSNTAQVFDIVARLDVNYNGAPIDYLTYWVNPTDFSSQAALDKSSLLTNDTAAGPIGSLATYAAQGNTGDFTRLTYITNNFGANANFGDVAMGQSLNDLSTLLVPSVTSVPEPGSLVLAGIGMVGVLGLAIRRRAQV